VLIHVLRIADPSLADALAIDVVTPSASGWAEQIELEHRSAAIRAVPRTRAGEPVGDPLVNATEVEWLEVRDLAVDGLSGLGTA
jgi:hypothetical protein